jgi:hypothetical protein
VIDIARSLKNFAPTRKNYLKLWLKGNNAILDHAPGLVAKTLNMRTKPLTEREYYDKALKEKNYLI